MYWFTFIFIHITRLCESCSNGIWPQAPNLPLATSGATASLGRVEEQCCDGQDATGIRGEARQGVTVRWSKVDLQNCLDFWCFVFSFCFATYQKRWCWNLTFIFRNVRPPTRFRGALLICVHIHIIFNSVNIHTCHQCKGYPLWTFRAYYPSCGELMLIVMRKHSFIFITMILFLAGPFQGFSMSMKKLRCWQEVERLEHTPKTNKSTKAAWFFWNTAEKSSQLRSLHWTADSGLRDPYTPFHGRSPMDLAEEQPLGGRIKHY